MKWSKWNTSHGHTVSRPDHPIRTAIPAIATCASPRSAVYRRRSPERTLLYRTVQTHLATWLALQDDGVGATASAGTDREFRCYLECGILAHRFARARCADCGHDFLVAYYCKGRGICPSCNMRRMVKTAPFTHSLTL